MAEKHLTLNQLNNQIKEVVSEGFKMPIWVIAEISELRLNSSGHCYLELIEKDESSDSVIARVRGMIWSFTYRIIEPYFKTSTGTELQEGMKVLIQVIVEFHEIYGLSLNIRDIDPAYTIGDIAKRRQEVINQLETEGVLTMNKELELPQVIKNIAVISSKTAAGFGDFIDQLTNNEFGYSFNFSFFDAVMQGENAPKSIIASLDQVFENEEDIDIVVIIRGGGAKADLFCFDDYWLAFHITQFPIPVLSGIGHERDDTITDIVAYENLKTPTAVADYIIEKNYFFEQSILELEERLKVKAVEIIENRKNIIDRYEKDLPLLVHSHVNHHNDYLNKLSYSLKIGLNQSLNSKDKQLDNYQYKLSSLPFSNIDQQKLKLNLTEKILKKSFQRSLELNAAKFNEFENLVHKIDPKNILKKGYTLVEQNKKVVTKKQALNLKDDFDILFQDGKVKSSAKNQE